MSDPVSWQEGNDRYLEAALTWLRLRLERLVGPSENRVAPPSANSSSIPVSISVQTDRCWLHRLLGCHSIGVTSSVSAKQLQSKVSTSEDLVISKTDTNELSKIEPVAKKSENDEKIAQAEKAMEAAREIDPPPALILLGMQLGLSKFEQEILLLCSGMELDTRIGDLCAQAQGDPSKTYPTFALALALFDDPVWDALSHERPLRYWRLLEVNMFGPQPLTCSPLRADERIVNYLKGLNCLDDRLAPRLMAHDTALSDAELPPSQKALVDKILVQFKQTAGRRRMPVIQMLGNDSSSKQIIAQQTSAKLGLNFYRMPSELLPAEAQELETLARLWERESILLPISLYLDAFNAEPGGGESPVSRFLARSNGFFFLDTRDVWPGLSIAASLDISKPTPAEQEAAWAAELGSASSESPGLLAGQFNLNLAAIKEISSSVLAEKGQRGNLHDSLWDSCLVSTRPRLDVLAQRLNPKATWEDIVLPKKDVELLRQIADQVRNRSKVYDRGGFRRKMNRGLGIGVLFAGESGTGKTMAAEVLANELRLNLYRIDLSQVISKYIGETEKNLRKLFDAAEDGGAILFFDEADALFGKRSEVKDSHDRYANIEINYLLQRMEAFSGLAILATNMKSALDPAFVRRLRFIVDFAYPGPEERKAIWLKVFPPETKTEGLDYERLSKLNLNGGSIHNTAINAAFLAAAAGTSVNMVHVLDAARTEFRKAEKPINEADFRL